MLASTLPLKWMGAMVRFIITEKHCCWDSKLLKRGERFWSNKYDVSNNLLLSIYCISFFIYMKLSDLHNNLCQLNVIIPPFSEPQRGKFSCARSFSWSVADKIWTQIDLTPNPFLLISTMKQMPLNRRTTWQMYTLLSWD